MLCVSHAAAVGELHLPKVQLLQKAATIAA